MAGKSMGNALANHGPVPLSYLAAGSSPAERSLRMVIARIRTNARRITVRVRNGPARTIVARPGRKPVVLTPRTVTVTRPKPTLRERLRRAFRRTGRG